MVFQFVINGEVPSKKNSVKFNSKTHRTYKTQRFREWHDLQMMLLNSNPEKPKEPITHCEIHINLIHGDLKRRDCDNATSSILDLLQDCNIITDDNWKVVSNINISNDYEKNNAKCLVTIIF